MIELKLFEACKCFYLGKYLHMNELTGIPIDITFLSFNSKTASKIFFLENISFYIQDKEVLLTDGIIKLIEFYFIYINIIVSNS